MRTPAAPLALAGLIAAGGLQGASGDACPGGSCATPPAFAAASAVRVTGTARHQAGAAMDAGQPAGDAGEITLEELRAAIDRLGAFEYADRMKAAQVVRRTRGTLALPTLIDAASGHADGYVRYKALVLLSGYDDPRVPDQMERALDDPNDRLRAVAYQYFEYHPNPRLIPRFLAAFEKELAEFVRPALVRAMAAQASDPKIRAALLRDVTRGQDFFRSTVIEALGDYAAAWAAEAIAGVARLEGPLQDDAALALGKIGGEDALGVLAGLQRTAPKETQPAIAAGLCLLGRNCETHRGFLVRTLSFADETLGFQDLLRGAAYGLAEIASTGDPAAAAALFDTGVPSSDPARAPIALAAAELAISNPSFLLEVVASRPDQPEAIRLLREGFDMLEEDFLEEQFYVATRSAFWAAGEGSPERAAAERLVRTLEF